MTPEQLTQLIENIEGVKTVELIPSLPFNDDNEILLLITINPLSQNDTENK